MKTQDFTAASVKKIVVVFCALFRREDYVPSDDGVQERTSKDHVRLIACVATSSGPPLAAASGSTDGGRIILTKARAVLLKVLFSNICQIRQHNNIKTVFMFRYICRPMAECTTSGGERCLYLCFFVIPLCGIESHENQLCGNFNASHYTCKTSNMIYCPWSKGFNGTPMSSINIMKVIEGAARWWTSND